MADLPDCLADLPVVEEDCCLSAARCLPNQVVGEFADFGLEAARVEIDFPCFYIYIDTNLSLIDIS
jgi:hypothetical protein